MRFISFAALLENSSSAIPRLICFDITDTDEQPMIRIEVSKSSDPSGTECLSSFAKLLRENPGLAIVTQQPEALAATIDRLIETRRITREVLGKQFDLFELMRQCGYQPEDLGSIINRDNFTQGFLNVDIDSYLQSKSIDSQMIVTSLVAKEILQAL